MLLECNTEERELLLRLPEERERRIEEALSVLREAGDPRVTITLWGPNTTPLSQQNQMLAIQLGRSSLTR